MEEVRESTNVDELLEVSGKRLREGGLSSEDRLNESNVYLNLVKAKKENEHPVEGVKKQDFKFYLGLAVTFLGTAGPKIYEVWARRRTNQEGMFMEEKAGKFVPPKWFKP